MSHPSATVGSEINLTNGTVTGANNADILALEDGGFAVTYNHLDESLNSVISMQQYDSDGNQVGDTLQVNDASVGGYSDASLEKVDGGFVVSYTSEGLGNTYEGVLVKEYTTEMDAGSDLNNSINTQFDSIVADIEAISTSEDPQLAAQTAYNRMDNLLADLDRTTVDPENEAELESLRASILAEQEALSSYVDTAAASTSEVEASVKEISDELVNVMNGLLEATKTPYSIETDPLAAGSQEIVEDTAVETTTASQEFGEQLVTSQTAQAAQVELAEPEPLPESTTEDTKSKEAVTQESSEVDSAVDQMMNDVQQNEVELLASQMESLAENLAPLQDAQPQMEQAHQRAQLADGYRIKMTRPQLHKADPAAFEEPEAVKVDIAALANSIMNSKPRIGMGGYDKNGNKMNVHTSRNEQQEEEGPNQFSERLRASAANPDANKEKVTAATYATADLSKREEGAPVPEPVLVPDPVSETEITTTTTTADKKELDRAERMLQEGIEFLQEVSNLLGSGSADMQQLDPLAQELITAFETAIADGVENLSQESLDSLSATLGTLTNEIGNLNTEATVKETIMLAAEEVGDAIMVAENALFSAPKAPSGKESTTEASLVEDQKNINILA